MEFFALLVLLVSATAAGESERDSVGLMQERAERLMKQAGHDPLCYDFYLELYSRTSVLATPNSECDGERYPIVYWEDPYEVGDDAAGIEWFIDGWQPTERQLAVYESAYSAVVDEWRDSLDRYERGSSGDPRFALRLACFAEHVKSAIDEYRYSEWQYRVDEYEDSYAVSMAVNLTRCYAEEHRPNGVAGIHMVRPSFVRIPKELKPTSETERSVPDQRN